jgi:membrane protein DedA with SNARE-associated domain
MEKIIINLINEFGYFGIFFSMVLEAIIIVIPSELILATSGILISKKILNPTIAFISCLMGSVFCASIIYWMGYFGGALFIEKYGKYFFMKEDDIAKSNAFFNKYGLIASCIGRNFPVIRTLISLPIGISKLSFFKFILFTTIGSIPWTIIFIYFGYALGNNWIILEKIVSKLKLPIVILIFVLIISFIYKRIRKRIPT